MNGEILESISPTYVGDDMIDLTIVNEGTIQVGDVITLKFDFARTAPYGVVKPLKLHVQPGFGNGAGYFEVLFDKFLPNTYSFQVQNAGEYLVVLRELDHNQWQGRLLFTVAGDSSYLMTSAQRRVPPAPPEPIVTLLLPAGGESWQLGAGHTIEWEVDDGSFESFTLEVSNNGGGTWALIAAGISGGDTSYEWNTETLPGVNTMLRITGTMAGYYTYVDTSELFTVLTPSVTLTAPNSGTYNPGVSTNITWTTGNGASFTGFTLERSEDGGFTWNTIVSGLGPLVTSYAWTPAHVTTQGRIRVTAHGYFQVSDISNSNFTVPQPTITVTAPNGGESWLVGSSQNVTWSVANGAYAAFSIERSENGGSSWTTVAASVGASPYAFTPTVPTTQGRIRVTGLGTYSASDSSNANYTIPQPTVTVTAPNGGETWSQNSPNNITWSVANGAFTGFNIERSENGGSSWTSVVTGLGAGVTSYSWTPTVLTTQGRIRVTGTGPASNSDTSNANFTVSTPPGPWVTVSPTNCSAWWDPSAAVDGGSPNYLITSLPNRSVISGADGAFSVTSGHWKRETPPAFAIQFLLNSQGLASLGTAMVTAIRNGSWSMAYRCDPGAASQFLLQGVDPGDGNLRTYFGANRTSMTVYRQQTFPTPDRTWTTTYSALAAGRHTFGVTFTRSSPNSTAQFYLNGVAQGSAVVNTTLDLPSFASGVGGTVRMNYNGTSLSGAGWWRTAITAPDHATIHSWLMSVVP